MNDDVPAWKASPDRRPPEPLEGAFAKWAQPAQLDAADVAARLGERTVP